MKAKPPKKKKKKILCTNLDALSYFQFSICCCGCLSKSPLPPTAWLIASQGDLYLADHAENPKKPSEETPKKLVKRFFESFWASSLLQILITCNRRYVSSPSSLSLSTHSSLVYWPVGAVAYRLIIKLKITKPKAWSVAETRTRELTSLTTTHLSSPPSIHPMRRFNVSLLFLHFYREKTLFKVNGECVAWRIF